MAARTTNKLRVVGPFGMGKVIEAESIRLYWAHRRLRPGKCQKPQPGSVVWDFDRAFADTLLHYCRTASRIHRDLLLSSAHKLEPLYDDLLPLVAESSLIHGDEQTFSIVAKNVEAIKAGPRQVIGTIKNAIVDGYGRQGRKLAISADRPDVTLSVTSLDGQVVISRLLTEESMAHRGYRIERTEAPLRENLAACLLMLARFDARKEALIDPFCGSGTIAIEAALMAKGAPLTHGSWPALFPDTDVTIWASDIDSEAVRITNNNAERAGITVEAHQSDFSKLTKEQLPKKGLILANIPYGKRLEATDTEKLIRRFVKWAGALPGRRVALLGPVEMTRDWFPWRLRMEKTVNNGSVKARFLVFDEIE